MSDPAATFRQLSAAVDALWRAFPDQKETMHAGESVDQLAFTAQIAEVDWLDKRLEALTVALLPLGFALTLHVAADDLAAALRLRGKPGALTAELQPGRSQSPPPPGGDNDVSEKALLALETMREKLDEGSGDLSLDFLHAQLETMAAGGLAPNLALQVFLNKNGVRESLLEDIVEPQRPSLTVFLFPKALLDALAPLSLAGFERDFCAIGRRSVVLVAGMTDSLEGPLLIVAGRAMTAEVPALLSQGLPGSVHEATEKTLAFRAEQNVWLFPTGWLLPETFGLGARDGASDPSLPAIARQLGSFQALLAIIFLADHIEAAEDGYRVEFSGFGRVRLTVTRDALLDYEAFWPALAQLYTYSYEGLSPDKLEIAQQFLSLIVEDQETLCRKASEVEGATRKTYARALVDKVGAYFDARQKIQDRLTAAMAEASGSIIGLSRDMSSDLFKVAGVLAAATVGALLDPDITTVAALLAALVMGVYAGIVLFYHLPTLQRAYELRLAQHERYIASFKEVLRDDEWQAYLSDDQLGRARGLFAEKYRQTRWLYGIALAIAAAVVLGTGIAFLVR
jgi:hypothetical protein